MIESKERIASGLTIAIDGPAASGKTTVGLVLAKAIGSVCLDTGLMYRAVTWAVLYEGMDPGNEQLVVDLANSLIIDVGLSDAGSDQDIKVLVNGMEVTGLLRSAEVNRFVSEVSAYQGVRDAMTRQQQRIAKSGNIVMLGRDIGTVVIPDADLKFYLNASAEVRAQRRFEEERERGVLLDLEKVIESIKHRDLLDSTREHAPLRPADDAIVIDTDGLSVEEVVASMMDEVKKVNLGTKTDLS